MKLRSMSLLLAGAASLAACHSGSSGGSDPSPGPGAGPVQIELATLARAGMADTEDAFPRELNGLEVLGNDNPSEFDDWFD
jgi:hypothetical protein